MNTGMCHRLLESIPNSNQYVPSNQYTLLQNLTQYTHPFYMTYSEVIFEAILHTWNRVFNSVMLSTKPRIGVDQVYTFISPVMLQGRSRQFVVRRRGNAQFDCAKSTIANPLSIAYFGRRGYVIPTAMQKTSCATIASGLPLHGMAGCAELAMKTVSIKKEKVCVLRLKLTNLRRLEANVIFVFNE